MARPAVLGEQCAQGIILPTCQRCTVRSCCHGINKACTPCQDYQLLTEHSHILRSVEVTWGIRLTCSRCCHSHAHDVATHMLTMLPWSSHSTQLLSGSWRSSERETLVHHSRRLSSRCPNSWRRKRAAGQGKAEEKAQQLTLLEEHARQGSLIIVMNHRERALPLHCNATAVFHQKETTLRVRRPRYFGFLWQIIMLIMMSTGFNVTFGVTWNLLDVVLEQVH